MTALTTLLLNVLILLIVLPAWAANCGGSPTTYYVDYAAGADTNAGTSTGVAWKHCPGDANATDNASCTLQAGDTVIFKGGIEYNGTIVIGASGSSGSLITYDGNSSGSWGTGKAIIDGNGTYSIGFHDNGDARNYIKINNFEIRELIDNETLWYTRGVHFRAASTGSTATNLYCHEIGTYTHTDEDVGQSEIPGSCVAAYNPTSCTISNNTISKMGNAISISGGSGCTISGNDITWVYWGIDINGDAGLATGHTITGNTIHDLYMYDATGTGSPYWQGQLGGDDPHTDFIFIRQGGGTRPSGNIVEKNLFYNNIDFGVTVGGTAMVMLSYTDDNIIRNNVFINPHSYYVIEIAYGSEGNKIYNNTVYAPRASMGSVLMQASEASGTGNELKNNIFVAPKALEWDAVNETDWAINNNYYVSASVDPQGPWHKSAGSYYEFAAWKAAFSQDANSYLATDAATVKFVSLTGYPTNCTAMDLRLQSDSPAKDKGATMAGFTTDYLGTTRPQGAAWDIGAFEYYETGSIRGITASGVTIR